MITQSKTTNRGWQRVKLGDVCKINPRRPAKLAIEPSVKTTFVPMTSVDGSSGAITQPQERNFSEVSRGYTYFKDGDVLFAKITPCMQNGKHAIASGLPNGFGFGSTEFHVIRPSDVVIAEWIHKFIRQPSILGEAQRHFRGAVGQQRVPKEFLIELEIPLPPLSEQRRIAATLDRQMAAVERARKAAQEILDAAGALNAAILRELLPNLGGKLAGSWKWARLGDVCEVINGSGFSLKYQGHSSLPIPFIKVSDMNAEGNKVVISKSANTVDSQMLKDLKAKTCPAGSVIFPKVGGAVLTNKKRILRYESAFDNNVMGVVPIGVSSEWLFYWLQTIDLPSLANIQALPSIKTSVVKKLEIPLPPISEQRRIVALLGERLAKSARIQSAARDGMDAIGAMPASLLRRALEHGD